MSKNPYLTLTSKRKIKFVGKISTDPDQYMSANPVPLGILALVNFLWLRYSWNRIYHWNAIKFRNNDDLGLLRSILLSLFWVGFRVGDDAVNKIRVTPCHRGPVRGFSGYVSMIFSPLSAVFCRMRPARFPLVTVDIF